MSISLGDITAVLAGQYGMAALFVVIVVTGFRGMWVWGSLYQRTLKERDEWQKRFLDGLRAGEEMARLTKEQEHLARQLVRTLQQTATSDGDAQ